MIPDISIIVPVYNVENYLCKCMDSLLNQTLQNIEILLIDDGSKDNSGRMCDEFSRKDQRVRTFHKANGGVSSARNLGLEQMRGKYVAFVDPDDWIEIDTFEKLYHDLEQNAADAVFFGYDEVSEQLFDPDPEKAKSRYLVIAHSPPKVGLGDAREACYQMMLGIGKGYFTIIANKVFRAEKCRREDGTLIRFDEKIAVGEDGLWLVEMAQNCQKIWFDNQVFYHWLIRSDSASHAEKLAASRLSAIDAQKQIAEKLEVYGPEMKTMALAKLYDDCFFLRLLAYIAKDKAMEKKISDEIAVGKKAFWKAGEISKEKKIKYFVVAGLMKFHVNGSFVRKVFDVTSYKIKSIMFNKA